MTHRDLVLAFDTASENIALAVGRRDGGAGGDAGGDATDARAFAPLTLVASDDHPAIRQANVQLMPAIDALFAKNGLLKQQVDCVVCGLGPGSFTGVRIGVATAKGIARGLRVPLFGVSTLDAVAWGAWLTGIRGTVGVVADAMRGEVYPARFELSDTGATRLDPHTVATASAVVERWQEAHSGSTLFVIGDGLRKYADAFAGSGGFTIGDAALWVPTGAGLLCAFEDVCARGLQGSGEAGALLPVYTRLSDAEENERKRLAAGGQIAQGALVDVPLSGVADPARADAVRYRPMAADDLDQVSALERAAFPAGASTSGECWSRALFASELAHKDRTWWVAYRGGQLVGFAGGWVVDGALQLLDVTVDEQCRRRGIARELVSRLVRDGCALGAATASLEVRASNTAAQALYSSLGFEQIGLRPGYYSPRNGSAREAAVVMARALGEDASHAAHVLDEGVPGGPGKDHRPLAKDGNRGDAKDDSGGDIEGGAQPSAAPGAQPPAPVILAIETSCDETAAAVIDGTGRLLSDTVASQVDFHARFGGVVPEIASRKHTEAIVGVVDAALDEAGLSDWHELDALAVTYAPGLIGALVVGVAFAKGLSWATGLPLVRVNHLEGHIYANRLDSGGSNNLAARVPPVALAPAPAAFAAPNSPSALAPAPAPPSASSPFAPSLAPPFIIALLSGGHTMLVHVRGWGDYRILGQTLDDAVGEAFDKVAKALGLGYPGGPVISRLAEQGDPSALDFPRALLHSHDYRFSLSGLKTAVITFIKKEQEAGRQLDIPSVAASFQQAVIDVQVAKAHAALEETGCATFCVGGGVAANRALREAYRAALEPRGIRVVVPPHHACTDNAAMIARVALDRFGKGCFMGLGDDAHAQADLELDY